MRAKSERLAAPQVLADNYPQSAHDKNMNRIFLYGQFLTTVHCPLEGTPTPTPSPLYLFSKPCRLFLTRLKSMPLENRTAQNHPDALI
jgi:hypothetical protein